MSTQAKDKCPLCLETMDLNDKHLKACKCGYEICLWCWHHIMEMDPKDECGGRCPGCRSIYNKDRILQMSTSNQILKELCADNSNLLQEQTKLQKQESVMNQWRVVEEPIDPSNARVIQRKLVYIVGMPSEFASEKVLRQKSFLGQYGKIENIIIDNIGANQQLPDSGRVYVTFSREEEAVLCIESVNGYILDGRPLKATFGVTRYCPIWLSNKVCQKKNCAYVHQKALAEDFCTKDHVAVSCGRLQHLLGMNMKGPQQRSGSTLPSPGRCNSNSKDKICINDGVLPGAATKTTSATDRKPTLSTDQHYDPEDYLDEVLYLPQQRSGSTLPSPDGCNSNSKDKICINDGVLPGAATKTTSATDRKPTLSTDQHYDPEDYLDEVQLLIAGAISDAEALITCVNGFDDAACLASLETVEVLISLFGMLGDNKEHKAELAWALNSLVKGAYSQVRVLRAEITDLADTSSASTPTSTEKLINSRIGSVRTLLAFGKAVSELVTDLGHHPLREGSILRAPIYGFNITEDSRDNNDVPRDVPEKPTLSTDQHYDPEDYLDEVQLLIAGAISDAEALITCANGFDDTACLASLETVEVLISLFGMLGDNKEHKAELAWALNSLVKGAYSQVRVLRAEITDLADTSSASAPTSTEKLINSRIGSVRTLLAFGKAVSELVTDLGHCPIREGSILRAPISGFHIDE